MHEAVVFWLLVAVVCGSFAAAEYMYLVEVFRICRSRTQSLPYKVLVVLVAIADGIGQLRSFLTRWQGDRDGFNKLSSVACEG